MPHPFASKENEFWYHVSKQSEMPLAGQITIDFDHAKVIRIIADAAAFQTKAAIQEYLVAVLLGDPETFHDLRKLLAISDKRAYLELSYLAANSKQNGTMGICGCQPWNMKKHPLAFFTKSLGDPNKTESEKKKMAELLASYLMNEGLEKAFKSFSSFSAETFSGVFELLILPREVQQKAAKLRGHGCEAALAKLLESLNVRLFPPDKAQNPMGARDPNLSRTDFSITPKVSDETFSFDMLVLDQDRPRIAIQSLIHTSDPGQFGVNKSDETVQVATSLKKWNQERPAGVPEIELWGLVDGVGFSENKSDTINKMLKHFDTFLQLKTLYKAAFRLHQVGLVQISAVSFSTSYSEQDVKSVCELYLPQDVKVVAPDQPLVGCKMIPAGLARLYLKE